MKHKPVVGKKKRIESLCNKVKDTLGLAECEAIDDGGKVIRFRLRYENDQDQSVELTTTIAKLALFADWYDDDEEDSLVNLIARVWLQHLQMRLAGAYIKGMEKAGVI